MTKSIQFKKEYFISFIGVFSMSVTGVIVFFKLPPEIPIFYSMPQDKSQLGAPYTVFFLIALSGLFALLNYYLNKKAALKYTTLSRLMAWMTLLILVLYLIGFIHIIAMVF